MYIFIWFLVDLFNFFFVVVVILFVFVCGGVGFIGVLRVVVVGVWVLVFEGFWEIEEEELCLWLDDDEEELGRFVIGGMGVGLMGLGRLFGFVEEDGCGIVFVVFLFFKREDRFFDVVVVFGLIGIFGVCLIIVGELLGFMFVVLIVGEDWVCVGLGGWECGIIGWVEGFVIFVEWDKRLIVNWKKVVKCCKLWFEDFVWKI